MPDAAVPPLRRAVDAQGTGIAPLRWPLEALWAQLEPLRPGLSVEALVETDSTSTRLLERARSGDGAPCLLVAERQTAGRGRLGRTWFSDTTTASSSTADGLGSLTFSLGLTLAPADWSGLSLAVGVALAEALHPGVRLKWPNDLWLIDEAAPGAPGRKLGGVLIETAALPDGGRYAVIGVGLNLARPDARPEITQATAGWREIEPLARAPEMLARLAPPLLIALGVFEQRGFEAFATRFAARDALAGRPVQTTSTDAERGVAEGVDARGALRVRTERGEERLIGSGEVSVRPC
ncbi:biotin--[acetyl-CoA-carboxylase] ligase [Methylibium sp.]|uniref:biotin--[acetyl-CoA-carboxylase] ligase n=1 Tax=Methylibium sp. TaxID=2067992 RepID=UPI003BA9D29C